MNKEFEEWLKSYLTCDWEDYEGNLNDKDMLAAFSQGFRHGENASYAIMNTCEKIITSYAAKEEKYKQILRNIREEAGDCFGRTGEHIGDMCELK